MRPLILLLLLAAPAYADPPGLSYVFPAGGQRGTAVKLRVGGLNLYDRCRWEVVGKGLTHSEALVRIPTVWREGPALPLPDSQRSEDYPADMAGDVRIAADAVPGGHRVRVWTSEGAAGGIKFVVGELPEVVEDEAKTAPVRVTLPVTANGRIFPREDLDDWTFELKKGQTVTADVNAARLGSKLDARLEAFAPDGSPLAENDDARDTDPRLRFTATSDGVYRVRISDSQRLGSQSHVYRLTLTTGPYVDRVFPAGGQAGTKVKVTLAGANLPREAVETDVPGPYNLDVGDVPEATTPGTVATPCIVNGRLLKAGQVDAWRFTARKGAALAVEVREVGSPLLPVLEVKKDGKAVQTLRTSGVFNPPSDGDYVLEVRDRFASRGGPPFIYRIRLATPKPDFTLRLVNDAESLTRGGKPLNVRLLVEGRDGFSGPIDVSAVGLPKGVTLKTTKANVGQTQLSFSADKDAAIDVARVRIVGTAKGLKRESDELLLGVGLAVPFKHIGEYDLRLAPRGSVLRKKFRIERGGYDGPFEVRLADRQGRHLQGVTGPVLNLPLGTTEFEYPVTLPPWMEIGRTSRTVVMLIGKVKDGGKEHTVGYTSQEQNIQLIAVVETGRLGLELMASSVSAKKGDAAKVAFRVRRGKDIAGPVRVSAGGASVTLAADASEGVLSLPVNASGPLLVRAALETPGGAMTAEATVEVVAE